MCMYWQTTRFLRTYTLYFNICVMITVLLHFEIFLLQFICTTSVINSLLHKIYGFLHRMYGLVQSFREFSIGWVQCRLQCRVEFEVKPEEACGLPMRQQLSLDRCQSDWRPQNLYCTFTPADLNHMSHNAWTIAQLIRRIRVYSVHSILAQNMLFCDITCSRALGVVYNCKPT